MAPRASVSGPVLVVVVLFGLLLVAGITAVTLTVRAYYQKPLPVLDVYATYPGANAQQVAELVGAPIEQQVNGVEGMLAMSHQCTDDGHYRLTITFRRGTDVNIAQVLVQNRVSLAMPALPEPVKLGDGIAVMKQLPDR